MPQAWPLDHSSGSSELDSSVSEVLPLKDSPSSFARSGLRPVPGNRLNSAKGSTDERRNPFAVDSPFASAQDNTLMLAMGLNSLRVTGIVQEGSLLKALVDYGSEHVSLEIGDRLPLGVVQGLGFRVSAISFENGSISITNGREERQISVQR